MAIARSQMYRQLYGIGNLVKREEYGIGSKLKKFVRNIIPNEVAEIAVKAAPFVAPFNPLLAGAMAGFGGFDQTGRIGQSLKSAALTYGAGQLGRYVGGAGFQEGFNPFAGYSSSGSFGGLGSLFTSPIGTQTGLQLGQYELFGGPGSEQFKLNQNAITPQQNYLGGDTVRTIPVETGPVSTTPVETFNPRDVYDPNIDYSGAGTRYGDPTPLPTVKEQGYVDLIKKAGSFEDVPLSERFKAVKDIGSKTLQDVLYKPMINPKTGETTYILDKNVVGSIAIGAYSYYDALQRLKDAGDPNPEKTLTEEEYQRLRIDPEKAKYKDILKDEAFGIRKAEGGRIGYGLGNLVRSSGIAQPVEGGSISGGGFGMGLISKLIQQNPQLFRAAQESPSRAKLYQTRATDFVDENEDGIDDRQQAAGGGMMNNEGVLSITLTPNEPRENFQVGGMKKDMSNNRISQIIQLIRDAESMGDMERAEELRLDLFRETKKADGGRIGYQVGGSIDSYALTQRPDDLGLPGFDDDPVRDETSITMSEALQLAMDRGQKFYDPTYGFQINPLTKGRMGTGIDPNFIFQRAMQAEQDAAARTKPYVSSNQTYMPGVTRSTVISSPYQTMKQDLLMRQGSVQTGGTPGSASEGASRINPLFAINRLIQAEQDAAARVTPKMAKGGRINYFMGSEIPVRQNQGGITELDLRNKGGFIPVGIKEKADDVPAMLSRNEFVFTADAVRGAGKGSINKGAQKMYKLMKSLEKKVKKQKVK